MGGLVGFVFELVVLGSCVAAVVCNALLVASCELLELHLKGTYRGSVGLFEWNNPTTDEDTCTEIANIDEREIQDKAFKCARVCSLMSLGFGGVLFVFLLFKQYVCPLPCSQLIMDISSTGTQICLALVYVIWLSEACDIYQCLYGQGATYLILTQLFWLGAGCFPRCMREGRQERNQGGGRERD